MNRWSLASPIELRCRWPLQLLVLVAFIGTGSCTDRSVEKIARKVRPAVVQVISLGNHGVQTATGSGFFIDSRHGYIITNLHVVKDAASVLVRLHDGEEYKCGKPILIDEPNDQAVLPVIGLSSKTIPTIRLFRGQPSVGRAVVVVGHPLGLGQTVSDGIVSAIISLDEVGRIGTVFQITAPVSPGSSGSPVVDQKSGRVIGVATAMIDPSVGQNINFAFPLGRAVGLADADGKKATRRKEAGLGDGGLAERAAALYNEGSYTAALEAMSRLSRGNRRDPELFYYIGRCYIELQNWKQAAKAFNRATKLEPDYYEAWLALGSMQYQLGKYKLARRPLHRAAMLNAEASEPLYLLAKAAAHCRDRDKYIWALARLERLDQRRAEEIRKIAP